MPEKIYKKAGYKRIALGLVILVLVGGALLGNRSKLVNIFLKADFRLLVFPQKYTLAMSSTPGIRIYPQYKGSVEKVRFSAEYGSLLTWNASSGQITNENQGVEVPYGIPAFWTPLEMEKHISTVEKTYVVVTLLDKEGKTLGEKSVEIICDSSGFYAVKASDDVIIDGTIPSKP